ncbi:MAG TPA: DUF748 domain-containing protein [Candidatus Krumholzibacteria bacterium]|nr:DUF748 domain-containing protein [Candidatus Krumholzibacteria bacterium]
MSRLRRILVALGSVVIAGMLVVAGLAYHYTRPAYIEKRLTREFGGKYSVHVESAHSDPFRGTISATGVTIASDSLQGQASRAAPLRTRASFRLPMVVCRGVNFRALRHGSIDVDEIELDNPQAQMFLDRHIASRSRGPKRMPHEVLMASARPIRIGTLRVVNGDLQYAERSLTAERAGTFRFADMNATVSNITTVHGTGPEDCVIDVHTRLANSGVLNARFRYDLASKPLKMDYHATMGRMDVTSLNKLLINLKGIRVKEGTIDSLNADIAMRGDRATGTVRLPYHALKFEMLDQDSHTRDLSDKFTTFMLARKVHQSNPDDADDSVTVVTIDRPRLPEVSLIKFVWESVREGVLRSANLPEPPVQAASAAGSAHQ